MPKKIRLNALTFAKMMALLMEGEYSCREISRKTGLHYSTVVIYTRMLYREKVIYICGWEKDSRDSHSIRIFKIGRGKDEIRPRMSRTESARRYRAKKRQLERIGFLYNLPQERRL